MFIFGLACLHSYSYKHVDSGIKLAALIGAVTDKNGTLQHRWPAYLGCR